MSKDQVIVIRGELNWAKLVGDARPYTGNPKYDKGPYWSVDITPDAKSREIIAKAGIKSKLRQPSEKDSRKETYLSLTVLKNKKDGTPNLDRDGKQIVPKISSVDGRAWDNSLLGNGTFADIKVKVKDYGDTTGAYFQEMRVLKHVPYEGGGFAPLSEDDEFWPANAAEATDKPSTATDNPDDLEDDVPFDTGN
jgi:hypothetical protein